jgi:hypothetical protein
MNMAKKIETKNVVEFKKTKEREDKAVKYNQTVLSALYNYRKSTLILASALKEIRDSGLYRELDYGSFNEYLATPEICLKAKTADSYIGLYEYWIEERKKKIEDLQGIATQKLYYLKDVQKPEKYFDDAKTMAWSDFKKHIDEKEHGIPADEKEIEKYIARKKGSCPNWDEDKKCCVLGHYKAETDKKKVDKKDDLI